MKEPVDHILRPSLPWRPAGAAITECGYAALAEPANEIKCTELTRQQLVDEIYRLNDLLDGQYAPDDGWRDIASAPKDGTPFLAWCPVIIGLGDSDATPDAEMRVVWWEARGQFTSDRDLGNESFTHWRPLPPPPAERKE